MNVVMKGLLMKSIAMLSRKPQARVSLERWQGLVLDVGGGGEGTIARANGRETVCVDISKREIDEAKSRGAIANWVLCDACFMPFKDGSFDAATFFFSLMYIKTAQRKRAAMAETKRILEPNGLLHLWDASIQEKPDLSIIFVEASLPDGNKISTGYGVKGKEEKTQNLELISKLAAEVGLKVARARSHKDWFEASFGSSMN